MSAMHQHLRDWREANLADWRATDLADRPARTTVYAAVLHESDGIAPARFGTVSAAEAQRLRARDAIAVERYVAPESRALTRLNYLAAAAVLAATVGLYACTGSTDAQDRAAIAAQVADARVDEWMRAALQANPALTPEQLARVRAAAAQIEREARQ